MAVSYTHLDVYKRQGNIQLQIQFKLFQSNGCLTVCSKGDAIGGLRGVDPRCHRLLAIVDKNLHAVFIQQDAAAKMQSIKQLGV